jgi:hypothetical protein
MLREEQIMKAHKNRMLKISRHKDEVTGSWSKQYNEKLLNLHSPLDTIKSRRPRVVQSILARKPEGKRSLR